MNSRIKSVTVSALMELSLCCSGTANSYQNADKPSPLVIQEQGSFFVGGSVRRTDALSIDQSGPDFTRQGEITTGQMYVQYQVPVAPRHLPVVMVHGGGLSGQAYETTPDGRMGWSEYFLRAGRPVYIVDQAGRGRSGFDGTDYNAVKLGKKPARDLAPVAIIGHEHAWMWFRIGPKPGVAFPDTQFPVNAANAFFKMWIPDLNASFASQNPTYSDLALLGKMLRGVILMGHSESFMFPERAALVDPVGVKGIISLESGFACATPFTQIERKTLATIPILIVFADHLGDAPAPLGSRWKASLAQCREFAAAIRKEGGDVTLLHLPEIGIRGNTHMFMLDKNNLQIADLLLGWIDTHVEHRQGDSCMNRSAPSKRIRGKTVSLSAPGRVARGTRAPFCVASSPARSVGP
jgi:pimeloyl-ACP methyl ester carboxylesterase